MAMVLYPLISFWCFHLNTAVLEFFYILLLLGFYSLEIFRKRIGGDFRYVQHLLAFLCLPTCMNVAPTKQISVNFDIGVFYENLLINSKFG